jgi:predicted small lipoprotein YifL
VFARASCFPARSLRALALAGALGLAACGRIGPLEPPAGAAAAQPAPAPGSMEAMSPMVKPKIPPITPPNQPFILDPLLK